MSTHTFGLTNNGNTIALWDGLPVTVDSTGLDNTFSIRFVNVGGKPQNISSLVSTQTFRGFDGTNNALTSITLVDDGDSVELAYDTVNSVWQVTTKALALKPGINSDSLVSVYSWEVPVPLVTDLTLDSATLAAYTNAILSANGGSKQAAGANAIASIFNPQHILNVYQDTNLIISAVYSGSLTVIDTGTVPDNVSISLGVPVAATVNSASLSTGVWTFHVVGGATNTNTISGTVGGVGSGANLILDFDPVAGMGFTSNISFVVPQSVDIL